MLSLDERVYRTIHRHGLLAPGARVIVALSGGADSTALACLLGELSGRAGFRLVGAAHFNHRARGLASDEDQRSCALLAERLGIACRVGTANVRDIARAMGASFEDAGRQLRYSFLQQAAASFEATHVAVGHTRDDQAETVLLQMFRGAGPRGLRAMSVVRLLARPGAGALLQASGVSGQGGQTDSPGAVRLVRPLLEVRHAELVAWLRSRGVSFTEDETNHDTRFLRNRIRHEVIPFLEARVSASVARVLARDAAIAASDGECLEGLARNAFARIAVATPEGFALNREALVAEPEAIARRVALLALGNLPGARFVGFDQADRVVALAAGRQQGPMSLPGGTATTTADSVVLRGNSGERGARGPVGGPGMNLSRCALSIPGEAVLPGSGWRILSFLRRMEDVPDLPGLGGGDAAEAVVDAASLSGLAVRCRRPGDWLRPLGLKGRKKLQDYFVDRKVPREERDRVPLVVDERDRIVWVAGHGIDEEFRVGAHTRDVVILKLRGESA